MKWLAQHFSGEDIAPADFVLSRHVEVLRGNAKLVAVLGGKTSAIRLVPLGRRIETGITPLLACTLPKFYRTPQVGVFRDEILVRDILTFRSEPVLDEEPLWSPSIATFASHLIRVAESNQQLTFNNGTSTFPLVSRMNLQEISIQSVEPRAGIESDNLFEMRIDFMYSGLVAKNIHKLYSLVTAAP